MGKDSTATEPVRKRGGFLHSRFGHIVVGVLAAVIVGVSVWGTMTLSGNRNATVAREQSTKDVAEARGRLAVVSRNGAIREAQTRLYEAAIELERRNFGTANTRLKDAGKALAALSDTAGTAGNDVQVARLQQAIAGLDLNVATDVSTQRDQVLELAQQAGNLIPTP